MDKNQKIFSFVNESIGKCEIINGDCGNILMNMPSNHFDLIISSPPYNIGKEYEKRKSIYQYLEDHEKIIYELVRVLSHKGSICWQVGNYVDKGEIFPLDIFYYKIFKDCGLKLRNRIIWHFGHGLHAKKRFSGRYETILWFTKEDKYIFNLDDVRVRSKYPGKKHFKGPNKGKLSGNPKGKNPSDYWTTLDNDWNEMVWEIPNVKANHPEKTIHPCQFPIELIERCVLALTNETSWVLDPFVGVGSTIIGSIKHNRNAVGIDKEKRYVKVAKERVELFKSGDLKIRPMTKKIYNPSKSKLSEIPKEWR